MLLTYKGIVIKTINYSESSVIVKVFTDLSGLQTFMIKGARTSKSKNKISLLQQLSIIEMVAYNKNTSTGIKLVKELKALYNYQSLPYDIYKSSIAMFINELIYKTIKDEERNEILFSFLFQSLIYLDSSAEKYFNFHLIFMLQYAKISGFSPSANYDAEHTYFNLNEGVFQSQPPLDAEFISPTYSKILHKLQNSDFENMSEILIDSETRRYLIEKLLLFYRLHINGFTEINSLKVLHEILT